MLTQLAPCKFDFQHSHNREANMRKPLVIANWKMHGSKNSVASLLASLTASKIDFETTDVVVLVPYVFLAQVEKYLVDSNMQFGVQNLSEYDAGAYTGEISAVMLTDFSCDYVCVGHSERRALYNETNELVADKWTMAMSSGLVPILCVGETKLQRDLGETKKIIKNQLNAVLNHAKFSEYFEQRFVIAYEPVWAIGTGLTPTPDDAQDIHAWIRMQLAEKSTKLAESTSILYGGSVNPANAKSMFAMPDIDGGLVGGASLDADKFLKVIELCNNCYYSYT